MTLFFIFLSGLTVGGLTCLAVQGGLLAALISEREKESLGEKKTRKETILPTISFLSAKLVSHVALGFILGLLGGAILISDKLQIFMQMLAGIYMVVIALNLLDVHPIFRYAVIKPPKFFMKKIRNASKSKDIFAPGLMGFLTIFIPCGATLAMEGLAIASKSGIKGALIMGAFVLGTFPLFLGFGYITTFLGNTFKSRFLKVASLVLIYFGLTSFGAGLTAYGINLPKIVISNKEKNVSGLVPVINGVQTAEIGVYGNGYQPNYIKVRVNEPVKINLVIKGSLGCTAFFRIPEFGISKNLFDSGFETVEFTPTKVGKITYTCSMGMYSGIIEVI